MSDDHRDRDERHGGRRRPDEVIEHRVVISYDPSVERKLDQIIEKLGVIGDLRKVTDILKKSNDKVEGAIEANTPPA